MFRVPQNLKRTDFPSLSFWLGFSIVSSWISQSLLDLSFGIAAIIWLSKALNDKSLFSPNSHLRKIIPLMLGYLVVAALGLLLNGRPEADIFFNLSRFFWIVQFVLLTYMIRHVRFSHYKPLLLNYLILFIPAIYGLNILWRRGNIDYLTNQPSDRVIGLVKSSTYHAHIAGFFIVISVALLCADFASKNQLRIKRFTPFWALAGLFTFSTSLLFTWTRGAYAALFISLAIFGFFYFKKYHQKVLLVAIACLCLTFAAKFMMSLNRAQSDQCRVDLLKVHYEIYKKYPLLGMGYRDNMRNLSEYWPAHISYSACENFRNEGSQAHNQYVNVAATTGSLGLLFFLSIIFYFLHYNWKWWTTEKSILALTCLTLQIYFLMSYLTETTFEFAKIRFLLLAVWAIVINKDCFTETKAP